MRYCISSLAINAFSLENKKRRKKMKMKYANEWGVARQMKRKMRGLKMEKVRQWSTWESWKKTRGSCLFLLKTEITQPAVKAGVKMKKKTGKVPIKEFLVWIWEWEWIFKWRHEPNPDARREAHNRREWKNERGGGERYGGGGGGIKWGMDMRRREEMRRGRMQHRLIDSQE